MEVTNRVWGYWKVFDEKPGVKVKELVINPGCSLSDQRHFHRSEHWYILQGNCMIDYEDSIIKQTILLSQHQTFLLPVMAWHRAYNITNHPCHILEVQYGTECQEEDIERR
jgi:mannose-6-phosphate isomerase-like protein (cupin superfamily)